ncbi:MAG: hypothetical protein AAGA92_11575 [Planctomycetota bacterium]
MNRFGIAAALLAAVLTLGATAEKASAGDPCCCPPAPIQVELCVKPPCSCVGKTVCVCVPGCCTEPPCVTWKKGLFGRCIGTYCWPSCGHEVKVVVTRKGDVKVRG